MIIVFYALYAIRGRVLSAKCPENSHFEEFMPVGGVRKGKPGVGVGWWSGALYRRLDAADVGLTQALRSSPVLAKVWLILCRLAK
jgi:hypothetical protein